MKELEMIKAFAELDGLTGFEMYMSKPHVAVKEGWATIIHYNPITDLALNCAARDKYEVEVSYHTQFDCGPDGSGSYDVPYATASTEKHHSNTPLNNISSEAICLVVIECILKSKGLWK